ncbi:MAG TPA: CDP-alcohol phosphatidyltransferase family protein [Longimicrobiales bacterium]
MRSRSTVRRRCTWAGRPPGRSGRHVRRQRSNRYSGVSGTDGGRPTRLASWPNAISLLRFPLAALFVLAESAVTRSAIALVAGISDGIDGWIARRTGSRTRTGELLDPIADKTFVFAALAGFVRTGELRLWELLALLARDVYVSVAFLAALALRLPIRFRARPSGKVVTTLQIVDVLVLLLAPRWIPPFIAATAIAGIGAIIDYTREGLRSLRGGEAAP